MEFDRRDKQPKPPESGDPGPQRTSPSVPDEFQGASAPLNFRNKIESPPAIQDKPTTAPQTMVGKFLSAIKTTVLHGAIWNGVGSVVVCTGSSPTGMFGHALATLVTLYNKLRVATQDQEHATSLPLDSPWRNGIPGLMRDIMRSPGLNMAISGFAFLAAAVQSAAKGMDNFALAFGLFVVGQAGVTAICNQGYHGQRLRLSSAEKIWAKFWQTVPDRAKNILSNPAPWFAIGNISIAFSSFKPELLVTEPTNQALLLTGVLVVAASALKSVADLFQRKVDAKPSGGASYLVGGGTFLIGLAILGQGNLPVGTAYVLWSVSNLLWGQNLNSTRDKVAAKGQAK